MSPTSLASTTQFPPRPPRSLVICDPDGAQLFSGRSLLGVQLGALRIAVRQAPPTVRATHQDVGAPRASSEDTLGELSGRAHSS